MQRPNVRESSPLLCFTVYYMMLCIQASDSTIILNVQEQALSCHHQVCTIPPNSSNAPEILTFWILYPHQPITQQGCGCCANCNSITP
jgi:hypothetical protein